MLSRHIEKMTEFCQFHYQKGHFSRSSSEFGCFSSSTFQYMGLSKTALGYFFAFFTKTDIKHELHAQNQNLHFDIFDLVTSDDLDLTRGHQRLRRVLRSIPNTIHAVPKNTNLSQVSSSLEKTTFHW